VARGRDQDIHHRGLAILAGDREPESCCLMEVP
jgi:hypothetical protein